MVWKVLFKSQGYGGEGKNGRCVLHGLRRRETVRRRLALAVHRLHHQAKVVPRNMVCGLKPENKGHVIRLILKR